ncbi:hypothetical protein C5167_020758 [Papaver somniferum]|uniref:Uncharacterized protein n=1 Tax=Papaver somniferum TaxID=3469 RepID=A0A4Y7IX86_PAPSO|nr:hypothetical protein C5167_020758 [Papaver somniferum]
MEEVVEFVCYANKVWRYFFIAVGKTFQPPASISFVISNWYSNSFSGVSNYGVGSM